MTTAGSLKQTGGGGLSSSHFSLGSTDADDVHSTRSPSVGIQYEFHLRHLVSSNKAATFKQPWEHSMSTPWDVCKRFKAGEIFGKGPMPPIPKPITVSEFQKEFNPCGINAFKDAGLVLKSKSDEKLWSEKLSWERKAAYKKWTTVILKEVGAFDIARKLFGGSKLLSSARQGLTESIMDSLGTKATSTLHARVGPLLHFINHHEGNQKFFFPMDEQGTYEYMKSCEHRAPSFLRSFLLSVSFARHHFGLHGAAEVLESRRIQGCDQIHFSAKRKLVQRPPLTKEQIMKLEEIVHNPERTSMDRLASGFFLTLTYGRLRFSDGQQVTISKLDMPNPDQGFLEGHAERTKTGLSLEKKTRLLPIAVPTISLLPRPWIPVWLDLRKKCLGDNLSSKSYPLLPSPAANGTWTRMPLSVTAGSQWLRSLLGETVRDGEVQVGTHSCKASMLSWCAKHGINPSHRRILGYHCAGRDKSLLTYSRDGAAEPLRQLCKVISDVKTGSFLPDCTRSGRFPLGANNEQADMGDSDLGEDSSESSSEDSADESEPDDEIDELACKRVVGSWDPEGGMVFSDDVKFARHRVSRCIHVFEDEGGTHLRCGRRLASTYVILLEKPAFMHPLCNTCFKSEHK